MTDRDPATDRSSASAGAGSRHDVDLRLLLDRFATPGSPKYMSVRATIAAMIEEGHWEPEAKLPPEQEIVRLLGVSLGTVQKALGMLADEGVLERVQGRGTFVSPARRILQDPWHFRFLADDEVSLLPVYTTIVSRDSVKGEGSWTRYFGEREEDFIRLRRVIDVNHEFRCFNLFYMSAAQFGRIVDLPLSMLHGNIKTLLQNEFGVFTRQIKHRLRAGKFTPEACKQTGSRAGTNGIIMDIYGATVSGSPIYYQKTFIPPNERWLVTD